MPNKNKENLAKAIEFAAVVHSSQYDKGGMPYILHPLRVMQNPRVTQFGSMGMIVAVLHDTIEDAQDPISVRGEIATEFGVSILEAVETLSRAKGEDYGDYVDRVAERGGVPAAVKLADLEDNLNILRQPTLNFRDIKRLERYHHAYGLLRGVVL